MPLILIADPSGEPVTSAEIKASARIDGTDFDSQIAIIIPALRHQAEARIGRRLITQTVELVLDAFPVAEIDLTLPNVQSIVSVKYIDTAGVEQTLASNLYSLDSSSTPCWLLPARDTDWPATLAAANAVRVRFVVGYGATAASVPDDIRLWMIAHACQVLRLPEGITSGTLAPLPFVDRLLDCHVVWRST